MKTFRFKNIVFRIIKLLIRVSGMRWFEFVKDDMPTTIRAQIVMTDEMKIMSRYIFDQKRNLSIALAERMIEQNMITFESKYCPFAKHTELVARVDVVNPIKRSVEL